jgi:hypothetical protein
MTQGLAIRQQEEGERVMRIKHVSIRGHGRWTTLVAITAAVALTFVGSASASPLAPGKRATVRFVRPAQCVTIEEKLEIIQNREVKVLALKTELEDELAGLRESLAGATGKLKGFIEEHIRYLEIRLEKLSARLMKLELEGMSLATEFTGLGC